MSLFRSCIKSTLPSLASTCIRPIAFPLVRPIFNRQTLAHYSNESTKNLHEQVNSTEYANPIDNPSNHDYFYDKNGARRITVHTEELPDPLAEKRSHRRYFYCFGALMTVTLLGIVKYEDANSPVVTSTLYTLRRSQRARDLLGDNISFYSLFPWVSGGISTINGNVDFSYVAKGSKVDKCIVKFKAEKSTKTSRFVVTEWSVTPFGDSSQILSLLDEEYVPFIPLKNEEATSRHRSENY